METTAEGVETHDDLALIRGLGCSHVQGYIYGKPMDIDEVEALLAERGGLVIARGFKSAREPRVRTFRTIQVESGGHRYEAIVRNLSSRGALLEGLWNVPEGTPLSLEFTPEVRVDGRARWSTESRVGVQFAEAVDTGALVRPVKAKAVRPRVHRAA